MNKKKKSNGNSILGTLAALIILCVVLTICSNKFLTYSNLMSVLKQTTFTALLASGMLLCLITAGIDLSVGANATFCACIMGMMVKAGVNNAFVLLVVALIAGTLIGLILGMKNFLWGASLLVTGSQMISGFPTGVTALGSATIGGFPVSFIVLLVIYVIMHILLTRTALGRSIYCAGGNMEATRLSGINSANVLTFCYVVSGFMAGLAGIVSVGRSGICNGANAIQPYDTDAIASCVIGGASFMGGKGTMAGTLIGALVIATLRNGFTLLAIDSSIQNMVLGLVIIGAVLLDVTRESMAAKARRKEAAAKTK